MSRGSATKFMMTFVQEYLDGKRSRLDFDLDFNKALCKNGTRKSGSCRVL
ncbi:hypothetical protein DESHY_120006 [Desulforamulus hydrothermalis Lam5 = DSM 18033]|uniref:Uncharacterized protein n=1 Tax=Desulforamulus hydrothermalis Lam5 = DSM 18033 TaxID=1121428 RepID=K8DY04_9FIRM|nr:hypothetical protein DESHY_120006 [Desulforamulus hydrothermalis Lam5 = DSM 18033]